MTVKTVLLRRKPLKITKYYFAPHIGLGPLLFSVSQYEPDTHFPNMIQLYSTHILFMGLFGGGIASVDMVWWW